MKNELNTANEVKNEQASVAPTPVRSGLVISQLFSPIKTGRPSRVKYVKTWNGWVRR